MSKPIAAAPTVAAKPGSPPRVADARPEFYTVKPGDTLHSIALEHGLDYRELAVWNGLDNPGSLRTGQQLRVVGPLAGAVATPLKTPVGTVDAKALGSGPMAAAPGVSAPVASGTPLSEPKGVRLPYSDQALAQLSKSEATAPSRPAPARAETRPEPKSDSGAESARGPEDVNWTWPTKGKVLATFNGTTSKGIDIGGKRGQAVVASASGRVIFSGTGVRGMGKFVVIKHTDVFISVYAHNEEVIVKYGQNVSRGQKIAEMGSSDTDLVKLHFEIRRLGNPVDPLKLLPEDPA